MTMTSDPLCRQVKAFCARQDMLPPPGGLILCAVSGGRDSMALLHLLSAVSGEEGFRVAAAHFNHCLRPTADRDEAFVRDWCRERQIPLETGRGDVHSFARETGTSLENAARVLRYRFLEAAADRLEAARIATAHHREDNTETVLLHLLRGSGLQGLGGIPAVRGRIIRPLLETGRSDVDIYIETHHIPYMEDESNLDTAYTRNRLRLEVLPLLEELSPGCCGRIAGTAALLREEHAYIQRQAERLLPAVEENAVTLPLSVLRGQDPVIRRRLVRAMGEALDTELTRAQTEAVLSLHSGGFLDLPGNLCAVRRPRQLILRRQSPPLPPLPLREGGQDWGPWRVTLERHTGAVEEGPRRAVLLDTGGALSIAPWDGTGRLAVENGSRSIKRLFADRGVPVERREDHPALLLDGKPVAVFGVASDWAFRPRAKEGCMVITLRRLNGEGEGS